jgi:hypothetical protein
MPAHIRKGLITGAPAFNSGGLGLSIGSRVGGIRAMISKRAPDGGKIAPVPEVTEYKFNEDFEAIYPDAAAITTISPHMKEAQLTFTADPETVVKMFTNKAESIVFVIQVTPQTLEITFDTGSVTKLESRITEQSKNNYLFSIPTFNNNLIDTATYPYPDSELYFNGTTVASTNSGGDVKITISPISGYTDDQAGIDKLLLDINTYIKGKTIQIEMIENNVFNVGGGTSGINKTRFKSTANAP